MTKEYLDKIVEERTNRKPFVDARFGDRWEQHARKHYSRAELINIALKNGRKAIVLEDILLNQNNGKN